MDLGIKNKVALVTAASQGLGKASAIELANEGVKLAICSRDQDKINQTAEEIQNLSGGRDVESVNLSDKQLMELANFQLQVENTRKQLREVRRNLSKDIDRLANQINILNTFLIPVLLILLMFFIPRQLGIRKRKSR